MHVSHIFGACVDTQVGQQVAEKFPRVTLCLEQEYGLSGLPQPLQQMDQQRGLARARRRDQRQEPAAGLNTIEKRGQRFAMHLAKIEIAGIGRDPKWLLTQAVVL